jgi:hypothetical protein
MSEIPRIELRIWVKNTAVLIPIMALMATGIAKNPLFTDEPNESYAIV